MRKVLFTILALFIFSMLSAELINIGIGNWGNALDNDPSVYPGNNKNGREQYLITAEELDLAGGGEGFIYSIAFFVNARNQCHSLYNYTIKMGTTTRDEFTEYSDAFETGLTTVVNYPSGYEPVVEWNTHHFTTPYYWDGVSNLIVQISFDWTEQRTHNTNVRQTNMTPRRALHFVSYFYDWHDRDRGTSTNKRPDMRFDMSVATRPPFPVTAIEPEDFAWGLEPNVNLAWSSAGSASGYKLYFGNSNPPAYWGEFPPDSTSIFMADLDYDTYYYWQVVPYNEYGDALNCPIWTFITKPDVTVYEYPFQDGFEESNMHGTKVFGWEQVLEGGYTNYWLANGYESSYNRSPRTGLFNATLRYSSNAWLMRPFYLEADTDYEFSLWARQDESDADWAVIRLNWGTSNNIYTMQNLTVQGITNGEYQKVSSNIRPDESGIYWLGINGLVSYDPYYLSIDDIMVKVRPNTPELAISPTALYFGEVGQNTYSSLPLEFTNVGGGILYGEDVEMYLAGEDADQFMLEPGSLGSALGPDASETIYVMVMPQREGAITATLVVSYAEQNLEIPIFVMGLPAGQVVIGNEQARLELPINPYYGYSYSQSIYYPYEIGEGAKLISSIAFQWNGSESAYNSNNWTIYMGHKDAYQFENYNDWLPLSQLSEVFRGHVNLPAEAGWIEITLTTPFMYNGSENLVIAVDENSDSYDSYSHYFYCTETLNSRSLRYFSDGTNPNPANPPSGTQVYGFPNLKINTLEILPYPQISINPEYLDFGEMDLYDTKNLMVNISNVGGDTLRIANISIDEPNIFNLQMPYYFPIELGTGQSISFPVGYYGAAQGFYNANISIDLYTEIVTLPVSVNCVDRAVSNFPYLQDFDGEWTGTPPAPQYWKVVDADNDGKTWNQSSQYLSPHSGMWVAHGMGNYDDYLITIPLNLEGKNVRMKWWDIVESSSQPTNYQVLVSTSNSNIYAFEDTLSYIHCTNTSWQEHELDLSDFNGERIYVAFHQSFSSSPYYGFGIDDVLFEEIFSTPTLGCYPDTLNFGLVPINEISEGKYVHLRNIGTGLLELGMENFELIGPNSTEFFFPTSVFPLTLSQNQYYDLPVFANPVSSGNISAWLKVSYGDMTYYVQLLAEVMDEGTFILGNGEYTSRFPLGSYYGLERSVALYEASEWGYAGLNISQIGWFAGSSTLDSVPTKIYLKPTQQNYLISESWDDYIAEADLVCDQVFLPIQGNSWQRLIFPGGYPLAAGNNLMVIVERRAGGSGTGNSQGASIYATEMYDHFMVMNQDNPPLDRNSEFASQSFRPNLLVVSSPLVTDFPPEPVQPVYPADEADMVSINPILYWTPAEGDMVRYKIYLGTDNPPAYLFESFEPEYAPPTLQHDQTYYWKIVPYNDFGEAEDCPVWSFTTTPDNMMIIGHGSTDAQLPINAGYEYSYSQSLYRSNDIYHSRQFDLSPNPMKINSISYYWHGGEEATNSNQWEIFMKNVWKYSFDSAEDWVPVSERDLVFSGSIPLPATAGWIEIELQRPFFYDHEGSLLIAVKENQENADSAGLYFHSTDCDDYQSIVSYLNDLNPNPYDPPIGELRAAVPNIRVNYYTSDDYSTPSLQMPWHFYFIRNSTLELDFREYVTLEDDNWDNIAIFIEPTQPDDSFVFTYLPVDEYGLPGQYLVRINSALQVDHDQSYMITVQNMENGRYARTFFELHLLEHFTPFIYIDGNYQYTGQTVHFMDYTVGNPNYWFWDFGDGATSTLQNPSHTYMASGTYDVSLTVGHQEAGEESTQIFYGIINMHGTAVDPENLPDAWDPSGSPYNLFGIVELPEGDDLTIDEGVEVLSFSEEPFVVNGTLTASGVTFGSGDPDGIWGGLLFGETRNRTQSGSSLENCSIINALLPVDIQGSSPTLQNISIAFADTTAMHANTGIRIAGNSSPQISDLDILNYGGGIQIQNDGALRSLPVLTNIRIRNSGSASRDEGGRSTGINLDGNMQLDGAEIENTDTAIQMQGNASPLMTNIRIRNSGSASRNNLRQGIVVNGSSSPSLEDIDIAGVEEAIVFGAENGIRSTTSPLLTNIRIRNSGSASRDEGIGITGIKAIGESNLSLNDAEIEGFATGIRLENFSRATANPLLTNIRIRNSGSASRNAGLGMEFLGDINLEMNDVYIEGYQDGIRYHATGGQRATANPLLTNIRIRNSGSASRQAPGNIGMDFRGLERFTCENDSIGGYQIGLKVSASEDQRATSSPLLTNIRIRNSGSASRNDNIGILLEDNVRGHLKDSIIEAAGTGIKITAQNNTILERLQVFNCHTGIKMAGNSQPRKLKGHLIALEEAYAMAHPSPDYRALALDGANPWKIQQNTISGYGKILSANNAGTIDFNSNIAWANEVQTQPFSLNGANLLANYNNFHSAQPIAGQGNIYQSPIFMNIAERDYSLHHDCACIDSGSPNLPPEADGTRADMGAFTYLHRASVEPDMRYIEAGTTVHFTNTSWGHDHPESICQWDLHADGQIDSYDRDWQYHFAYPGVYSLRLSMQSGNLEDTQLYEALIVVQAPQLHAPTGLNMNVQENNIQLSWEPVSLSTGGDPQAVEYYVVYSAENPYDFFQYVGHTTNFQNSFTHIGGADAPRRFYYVIGFNGSELELREYISRHQSVLRETKINSELKRK